MIKVRGKLKNGNLIKGKLDNNGKIHFTIKKILHLTDKKNITGLEYKCVIRGWVSY